LGRDLEYLKPKDHKIMADFAICSVAKSCEMEAKAVLQNE